MQFQSLPSFLQRWVGRVQSIPIHRSDACGLNHEPPQAFPRRAPGCPANWSTPLLLLDREYLREMLAAYLSRIRSCFIPCVFQFDSSVPEMWILSIPQMLRQPGDHHGYWYQLAKRQDEQSTKGSLCIHMNYYWQKMHTSWYGP